jgi:hypothetical protein
MKIKYNVNYHYFGRGMAWLKHIMMGTYYNRFPSPTSYAYYTHQASTNILKVIAVGSHYSLAAMMYATMTLGAT